MNELIKDLAIRAKIQMVSEPRLQEFTELIVQECIRMCGVAQMGYLTHGREKEASGASSVQDYILEHFDLDK